MCFEKDIFQLEVSMGIALTMNMSQATENLKKLYLGHTLAWCIILKVLQDKIKQLSSLSMFNDEVCCISTSDGLVEFDDTWMIQLLPNVGLVQHMIVVEWVALGIAKAAHIFLDNFDCNSFKAWILNSIRLINLRIAALAKQNIWKMRVNDVLAPGKWIKWLKWLKLRLAHKT